MAVRLALLEKCLRRDLEEQGEEAERTIMAEEDHDIFVGEVRRRCDQTPPGFLSAWAIAQIPPRARLRPLTLAHWRRTFVGGYLLRRTNAAAAGLPYGGGPYIAALDRRGQVPGVEPPGFRYLGPVGGAHRILSPIEPAGPLA